MEALEQAIRDQEIMLREQSVTLDGHERRITDLEDRVKRLKQISYNTEFALAVLSSKVRGENVDERLLSAALEIAEKA